MDVRKLSKFTSCGGCVSKLPPGLLQDVIKSIPRFTDENLLVGFDSSDDGAVYRLGENQAIIHTLDFFPPMVEDPYLFGKIAAANALSDVYAMGGAVITALNIVAFPEGEDPAILGAILKGGAEKVMEAGGVLCGGHSISDKEPKYGLSVTGLVHPERIMKNNACRLGDNIILTKPLGVGMITAAHRLGQASQESFEEAVSHMQTLNKYAMEQALAFRIHSATDVTGFGFLGHLNEMVTAEYSIEIQAARVPFIAEAKRLAEEFMITAGGMKNRKFLEGKVHMDAVSMALQEILLDPQTSGGLLLSVHPEDAPALLEALGECEIPAAIVGEVVPRSTWNIVVRGGS